MAKKEVEGAVEGRMKMGGWARAENVAQADELGREERREGMDWGRGGMMERWVSGRRCGRYRRLLRVIFWLGDS